MSISEQINSLKDSGMLIPYIPSIDDGAGLERVLYLTPGVDQWVRERPADVLERESRKKARTVLTNFVSGRVMGHPNTIKLLEPPPDHTPPGLFEFRFTTEPQYRMFFRVFAKDCAIALLQAHRDLLGPRGSSGWDIAFRLANINWNSLFPTNEPFISDIEGSFSNVYENK